MPTRRVWGNEESGVLHGEKGVGKKNHRRTEGDDDFDNEFWSGDEMMVMGWNVQTEFVER